MKKTLIIVLIASFAIIGLHKLVYARTASIDDALTVSNNWIQLVINKKGAWGSAATAEVEEIRELTYEGRTIGYFCKVNPSGFIIVSLRTELAPVKVYSAVSDIDPDLNEGLVDVIKYKMSGLVIELQQSVERLAPAGTNDLNGLLEINYQSEWDKLIGRQGDITQSELRANISVMSYQEGTELLTSSWHQRDPYNRWTPSDEGCTHTKVGCIATAAAQIMYYWSWPPYGYTSPYNDMYDWPNMRDKYIYNTIDLRWEDGNGKAVTQAQLDAVAEISYEAGEAAGMDYGCDKSSASIGGAAGKDMLDAYKDKFRYNSNIDQKARKWHTASGWFDIIKDNINANQPLQYSIQTSWTGGHSMVLDGWQVIGSSKEYHMNYGWDDDYTAWYTLDALHDSVTYLTEEMLAKIKPEQSLGSWIDGFYTGSLDLFNYRYFNVNATGYNAEFLSNQYLQFLPGVRVKNTNPSGGLIKFWGPTWLFTISYPTKGLHIYYGALNLYQNGSIKLY